MKLNTNNTSLQTAEVERELTLVCFPVMAHFSYVAHDGRNWERISSFVHHEPNDKHAWPGGQDNIFKVSQIYGIKSMYLDGISKCNEVQLISLPLQ